MHGVVDAHVHFWDPSVLRYPWLDALPALRHAFLPGAYAGSTVGAATERAVFVECNAEPAQSRDEVAFAQRFADARPPVAAIVAFVDLAAGGAHAALDALVESPLVKGVRQNIQGQPAGFCLQPAFVGGVREAGRRGLTFDLCATHDQLGDVVALVAASPDTRFVLDHCGKPAVRDRLFEAWARGMTALAAHANVACKISGLLTEAGPGWRDADLLPYVDHVVNVFGPTRVIYGSDWPVLTLAGRHDDWLGFTRRFTAGWRDGERDAFYHDNAVRTYALPSA